MMKFLVVASSLLLVASVWAATTRKAGKETPILRVLDPNEPLAKNLTHLAIEEYKHQLPQNYELHLKKVVRAVQLAVYCTCYNLTLAVKLKRINEGKVTLDKKFDLKAKIDDHRNGNYTYHFTPPPTDYKA